jgi:hypothetical protein
LLVGPTLALALLVRKEPEWIPDEQVRRRWAQGLVVGSVLAALLASFRLEAAPEPARSPEAPALIRLQGPRSK